MSALGAHAGAPLQVFQNLHRRIAPAGAHDAAAGMRRRAAHVKIANRRTVLRPTRRRPQKEKLFQGKLTLKNISFRQSEFTFEIERRQDLPMQNDVADIWRVLGDRIDYRVAKLFALIVPRSFLQVIRRVLNEAGHNVFARRRDRWISETGNYYVDVRTARVATILGIVISALHVFDAGRNRDRAAQVRSRAGQRLEIRQGVEREVYLSR